MMPTDPRSAMATGNSAAGPPPIDVTVVPTEVVMRVQPGRESVLRLTVPAGVDVIEVPIQGELVRGRHSLRLFLPGGGKITNTSPLSKGGPSQ